MNIYFKVVDVQIQASEKSSEAWERPKPPTSLILHTSYLMDVIWSKYVMLWAGSLPQADNPPAHTAFNTHHPLHPSEH